MLHVYNYSPLQLSLLYMFHVLFVLLENQTLWYLLFYGSTCYQFICLSRFHLPGRRRLASIKIISVIVLHPLF